MRTGPLLTVEDLTVTLPGPGAPRRPVQGVSFSVGRGETLCIVGESGCGKSLTALSLMGLLPPGLGHRAARLDFDGLDLGDPRTLAGLRGDRIAMIFQDPMTSLNPVLTVGDQLEEVWRRHRGGGRAARERALFLLDKVGIPNPSLRLRQYPHQLSGGLRQRVMVAQALMCEPRLIVADEPTTALDVTVQAQVLDLLVSLQREFGAALLLITHDLGVVARTAQRVVVMYAGQVIEEAAAADLFAAPRHPYTRGLIGAIPTPGRDRPRSRLATLPGLVPAPTSDVRRCLFADRCASAQPACRTGAIPLYGDGDHRVRCVLAAPGRSTVAP